MTRGSGRSGRAAKRVYGGIVSEKEIRSRVAKKNFKLVFLEVDMLKQKYFGEVKK